MLESGALIKAFEMVREISQRLILWKARKSQDRVADRTSSASLSKGDGQTGEYHGGAPKRADDGQLGRRTGRGLPFTTEWRRPHFPKANCEQIACCCTQGKHDP